MSINAPFGMPSRSPGHYGGDQFPHTYATLDDPISKKRDGWLARCTVQKACPKIMHMDSGTEAWLGGNALVITDASGKKDSRFRTTCGCIISRARSTTFRDALPRHLQEPLERQPAHRNHTRAAGCNAGVDDGREAPAAKPLPAQSRTARWWRRCPPTSSASRHPRGRLQRQAQLAFDERLQRAAPRSLPGTEYPELVPKVDADGNDIGGCARTCCRCRSARTRMESPARRLHGGRLCGLQGSYIPFAKTRADRGADPRPSLQERYGSHASYVAKVEAAVAKLVSEGFMLKEDAARVDRGGEAAQSWFSETQCTGSVRNR
jgi:hypothetical protein